LAVWKGNLVPLIARILLFTSGENDRSLQSLAEEGASLSFPLPFDVIVFRPFVSRQSVFSAERRSPFLEVTLLKKRATAKRAQKEDSSNAFSADEHVKK